jgi:Ran GTPase-activating protein (RanGAP) involved in mRNA processing and transport
MNDTKVAAVVADRSVSSTFLECCQRLRADDPTVLPRIGAPFVINRRLNERESILLTNSLLKNTNVQSLALNVDHYTFKSAETMGEYLRASKHLQLVRLEGRPFPDVKLQHHKHVFSILLRALQKSTSLKELSIRNLEVGMLANKVLETLLIRTQSLQKLHLLSTHRALGREEIAALQSALTKSTTLQALSLADWPASTLSSILASLHNHPHLRTLHLNGCAEELTGLDTLLKSNHSKITELVISGNGGLPIGLSAVLHELGRKSTLTRLSITNCTLSRANMGQLAIVLSNNQSLESLVLQSGFLQTADLAEIAPSLCQHTSIKLLDLSQNHLDDFESASLLRDIMCSNKTITKLDVSKNEFGRISGAVICIADGIGSNTALLEINLALCVLDAPGVSILARSLGSRNRTLRKLSLGRNRIGSAGVHALLDTMMNHDARITDLDLWGCTDIGNDGGSLLADALGRNALPYLRRLSLSGCDIGDDGIAVLVSALERNNSLVELELQWQSFSESHYVDLAKSLPEIKTLQRISFSWRGGLAEAIPFLIEGLRKNKSLVQVDIVGCSPLVFPLTAENINQFSSGWMQEVQYLGYRNRFRPLVRASVGTAPPLGLWSHALAKGAALPDALFYVLRSKPSLVLSAVTDNDE